MWPLLFSTQPICQKCSSDFIGTLNPSAICMSCLSHQDVITQRTEEKEDLEAGVQGKEPFSACNREQLWKKNPYDKDKGKVKGKRLTPSYRQWVHLCRCTGRGLLLLLRSDIVVPSARLMNESPCNRSSQLTLSLQQTKKAPFHTVAFTLHRQ